MDCYYGELTRDSITKAYQELSHAQQYMIRAEVPSYDHMRMQRIISGLHNYHKQLGEYLKSSK